MFTRSDVGSRRDRLDMWFGVPSSCELGEEIEYRTSCNRGISWSDHVPDENTRVGAGSLVPMSHILLKVDKPQASFFFGVRIRLGTILGRFSIIYFMGLGLRIRVRV